MNVPLWAWAAVLAVILAMLAVDLVAHRTAHVVSVREAASWSAIWVSLGLAFGGVVWWAYGAEAGGQYFAGYLIEKSLAVDNVFVFALIFTYFAVPREYQHRVLFYGVLGALVFRAIFIAGGVILIEQFAWVLYVFGAFLVFTGWKMFTHRDDEMDPSRNPVLRLVRTRAPSTEEYHGQKFWVKKAGKWVATPLFTVLVLVETTDIIFAVDSIPAIFAVTQEPFLVFTSNAFAILGLRDVLPARPSHPPVRLPQGGTRRDPGPRRREDAPRRVEGADLALPDRDRDQHHGGRRDESAGNPRPAWRAPRPGQRWGR